MINDIPYSRSPKAGHIHPRRLVRGLRRAGWMRGGGGSRRGGMRVGGFLPLCLWD